MNPAVEDETFTLAPATLLLIVSVTQAVTLIKNGVEEDSVGEKKNGQKRRFYKVEETK